MTAALQNFAYKARRHMTAAEERLWRYLRSGIALQKTHFRRQVILENYIADFCYHSSRLIIEIDGATHSETHEILKDEIRTHHLNRMGYRVLRFTNDDVFTSIDSVLDTIYEALQETPHVLGDVEKTQRRRTKKSYLHEKTPTPYPRHLCGSTPQGGGVKFLNLRAPSLPSPLTKQREPIDETANAVRASSSIPSPLEGEG